jgi:hypothetical protein
MTTSQLSSVQNFSIRNEFGCITFINAVDLKDVDVSRDVCIEQGSISIYSKSAKPALGS